MLNLSDQIGEFMYRRIVFVGLGGSGGKTLRFIKRDLQRWLNENNWPETSPIPKGFQFLHIDTPTAADGMETDVAMLPDDEYRGLVGNGITWKAIVSQLDGKTGLEQEFAGWRVEPTLPIDPTIGAGQYRAVGRTVALAYIDAIRDGLRNTFNEVTSPAAQSDLTKLWQVINPEKDISANNADPIVVVVSSLAGGTGAGLLLDVFDVMRTMYSWADNSFGILYTPEVFKHLETKHDNSTSGVQPNSLAAVCEILNGYFWNGLSSGNNAQQVGIGLKESKIYSSAKITGSVERSGPKYPILVGSTNAGSVQLKDSDKVFETIGSALVSWCIDEVVQSEVVAFSMANWIQKTDANQSAQDMLINVGGLEEGKPAFNGLGCARVSLGTRYLEDYSAQRLAREAMNHIANNHKDGYEAKQLMQSLKINNPDQIAAELAKTRLLWFVKQCGLDEKGPDNNDVVNALNPAQGVTLRERAGSTAMSLIRDGRATARDFLEDIRSGVSASLITYEDEMKPLLAATIKEWVKEKPKVVIEVIEKSIAEVGLNVTSHLVEQTIDYLLHPVEGVCAELMGEEHQSLVHYSSEVEWLRQAEAVLAGSSGRFSKDKNGDTFQSAISNAVDYGAYNFQAQLVESAAEMLKEFAKSCLKPILNKLKDAAFQARNEVDRVSTWPEWNATPPNAHLVPPASEMCLITPEQFSDVFAEQLVLTIGGEEGTPHKEIARSAVISGDFIRELTKESKAAEKKFEGKKSILITQNWNPGHMIVHDTNEAKQPIQVELKFTSADLENRAHIWLTRPNTAFEQLLNSDLRSYTQNENSDQDNVFVSQEEYQKRRERFVSQLQAALSSSYPLVKLDKTLMQALNIPYGIRTRFSKFPFAGHALQVSVENLIRDLIDKGTTDKYFSQEKTESVEIISMFEGAQHPFVIESLLQPIAEKWGSESVSTEKRGRFWTKRRARPLGEFIPTPQEHIVAMIRGWFTAQILGLLETSDQGDKTPFKIAQPWSVHSGAAEFPFPMLTSPEDAHEDDKLFAALEAIALAYVEVGNQNNLSPLRPYIALRDFGRTMGGKEQILMYETPNQLLVNWFKDGKLSLKVDGSLKDEKALRSGLRSEMSEQMRSVSGPESNPEDRRSAFLAELDGIIDRFNTADAAFWLRVKTEKHRLNLAPFLSTIVNTTKDYNIVSNALQTLREGIAGE